MAEPGPVAAPSSTALARLWWIGSSHLTSLRWRVPHRQGSAVWDGIGVSTYIKRGLLSASVSLLI